MIDIESLEDNIIKMLEHKKSIVKALNDCNNYGISISDFDDNIVSASKSLGMNDITLRLKMKKFKIEKVWR